MQATADRSTAIFDDVEDNKRWVKDRLGVGVSVDVLGRDLTIAGVTCHLVVIDGYQSSEVLTLLLGFALDTRRQQVSPDDLEPFMRERLPFVEVNAVDRLEAAVEQVLAGPSLLFVDGCGRALVLDTRRYPARTPSEPDTEKLITGPKDGFDETLLDNITLIRRRVRDTELRVEAIKVGRRSRNDVCLLYIRDIAQPALVRQVRQRLQAITTDIVPMGEKAITEFVAGPRDWWNPFPVVRYTERPDVCAAHLMEGRIVLLVDTTPVAVVLPVTFFDQMENVLEYHSDTVPGTLMRLLRYCALFLGWFFAPLYVWLISHPALIPVWLRFLGPDKPGPVPMFLQFIIADGAIGLIFLSLLNMPQSMTTTLGVIGAVVIGQLATKVKLLTPEAIIYVVIATLGQLDLPTVDLFGAIWVFRFVLYLLAALPWWPVLPIGIGLNLALLATTTSFGEAYLWPLLPLDVAALWGRIVRAPIPTHRLRPSFLAPRDPDRS